MLRNRVSSQFFMNFVLPIRIVRWWTLQIW
jgi:hypothetical protein